MGAEHYRNILEVCFPQLQIHSVVPISEGWDSIAVDVNGEYIFRFPKRPDVEPQYEKEARLLAELARHLPAPIPQFVFLWPGGSAYPVRFLGHRKLAGVPLDLHDFTPNLLESLAGQIGAFLAALHNFPVARAAQLLAPNEPGIIIAGGAAGWRHYYQQLYRQVREQALPLLGASARAAAEQLWENFLGADAYFGFQPALVHNDLTANHVLCDITGAAISGVIDWGDVAIGDPAIDFAGLLADCGADFMELALAAYAGGVDDTFRSRTQFYAEAMPFNDILFGLATGDAALVAQGVEALGDR
jgi:aminoglycoside 2''-phosphotransferase